MALELQTSLQGIKEHEISMLVNAFQDINAQLVRLNLQFS